MQQEGQNSVDTIQNLINTLIEFFVNYSFQVIGALIILVAGIVVSNWVSKLLFAFFQKKKLDVTLSRFLSSVVKIIILGFTVIIALGNFGITVAPFIAALGAVAFGATIAIQGPISNYGAGLSIILTRPFVVGNAITVAGVSGVVEEVKLANTILVNEDGVKIVIPNKSIVGEILHNSKMCRAAECVVGISYDSDPEKAIRLIQGIITSTAGVDQSQNPTVGIKEFGDSSINIEYRYWVPTPQYFTLLYQVNLAVLKAFRENGISIPFPQREVRVLSGAQVS